MATLDVKRSIRSAQLSALSAPRIPLSAIQHVRKLRGRTQPHLMRGGDGRLHVVKFQNNPFHPRVLANEFLASRLGHWLGLPMAHVDVIEVSRWLIAHTPDLRVEIEQRQVPCASGLQFASRYVADTDQDEVFDDLPTSALRRIVNWQDWPRVLAFDKWVGNADSRQAVFTRRADQRRFQVIFLDHGDCFNAGRWIFPDLPFMGTYYQHHVYANVTGWDAFEPMLSRIEAIEYADLWRFAAQVPQEWYQYDSQALWQLVETLHKRRTMVRDLITRFRRSTINLFRNWTAKR